eukprot:TRINITY_DN12617_c1_g2_i10.p1 TRINITY_DN12617_c1_g2~~TRINITY_DN12617_c1_g2_i10.p1  ORF type:complete len:111 (+),score=2.68 TRINITY_DN12617_c1_g2_i10:406-738(+)
MLHMVSSLRLFRMMKAILSRCNWNITTTTKRQACFRPWAQEIFLFAHSCFLTHTAPGLQLNDEEGVADFHDAALQHDSPGTKVFQGLNFSIRSRRKTASVQVDCDRSATT